MVVFYSDMFGNDSPVGVAVFYSDRGIVAVLGVAGLYPQTDTNGRILRDMRRREYGS